MAAPASAGKGRLSLCKQLVLPLHLKLREQAIKDGILEFRKALLLKVARGETSTEEVFRVIPTDELLLEEMGAA